MDITIQMRSLELLIKMLKRDMEGIPAYGYTRQMGSLPLLSARESLPRCTPEEAGLSSTVVERFFRNLSDNTAELGIHSAMLLRHGKVFAEGYYAPYRPEIPHMLYSASKSVTSTAIGMAVDEGLMDIDERLEGIFPGYAGKPANKWSKMLTVRHLLTMSTGVRFNEVGSALDEDWVKMFMESVPKFEPGTQFEYNSLNTYMLSAVLRKKTGMSLTEFLTPRLYEPLDIRSHHWETCPKGMEKGGWGLNLCIEDLAKIAQLYLNKGVWNGRRLLSEEWIDAATSPQIPTPNGEMRHGYGYQIWMSDDDGDYQFNGAFGQYVLVFPKYETVIAMYSGSSNLFVNGGLSGMVRELLTSFADEPLAPDNEAYASLKSTLNSLEYSPSHPRYLGTDAEEFERIAYRLDGREYFAGPNTGGLFPQTLQAVHSNMTDSVTMLRFEKRDKDLYLYIYEKDERNLLVLRHDGAFEYGAATMRGERQLVATRCRWKLDVNRIRLWVMTGFIETPNSRILTLDITPQKMSVTFDERPALDKTVQMLFDLVGVSSMAFYRHMLPLLQRENLVNLVKRFTEPVAECVMVKHNDEEPLPRIEK